MPDATPERISVAAVAALTVLALAIRASQFDQSLFGDELYALFEVQDRSFGNMLETVYEGPEVTPPLFFVLAWAAAKLGDPTIWLRLPSLVCGVLLVPATYVLGALTVGRRAGLAGAVVVTLAPFAIFYSVEARPYAMLALLTVASTIALLRAVDRNAAGWWIAYGLASAAALYTHLTAVFVLAAQAAWAVHAHRDRLRGLVLANAAAAALLAVWLPRLFRDDLPALVGTYGPFSGRPGDLAGVLAHILPGLPFVPLDRLPGTVATVAFAATLAALVAAGVASRARLPAVLVAPAVAVPAGLIAYGAVTGDGLFTPRTATTMLPYAALLIGALVVRLPCRAMPVAAALLFLSLAAGTLGAVGEDGQRPRYREAAAYIAAQARPGDEVLERELFPNLGAWSPHFAIYVPPGLPYAREGEDELGDPDRVFFVHVPVGRPAPATLGDGLVPEARRTFPGIHPVAVTTYVRRAP